MDTALADPLADARLDEGGDERRRRTLGHAGGERQLLNVRVALLTCPRDERTPEAPEQLRREARQREQVLLDREVALVEEQDAARRVPVATRTTGLLQVPLERCRRLVV